MLPGELQAGGHFEKVIGGDLVFRLEPEILGPHGDLHGWQISLAPSHESDRDYIFPVNPPLRFNGLQTLGPGYGDDTKTSLAHPHEMFFLLDRADYDRIWPLLTNALWPYSAPEPDKAGGNTGDEANNARVLSELAGVPLEKRTARFVCVIVAARDGKALATFRGVAEGRILDRLQGSGGFGYDPMFYFPPIQKTFAELSPEEKAGYSHRGAAFRKFLDWIASAGRP